jgi:hypothetical protein
LFSAQVLLRVIIDFESQEHTPYYKNSTANQLNFLQLLCLAAMKMQKLHDFNSTKKAPSRPQITRTTAVIFRALDPANIMQTDYNRYTTFLVAFRCDF